MFLQPGLKVLEVLDLGENHLGNGGIQVIREPLMVNSSVLHLGLAHTNITCEGTATLALVITSTHVHALRLTHIPSILWMFPVLLLLAASEGAASVPPRKRCCGIG